MHTHSTYIIYFIGLLSFIHLSSSVGLFCQELNLHRFVTLIKYIPWHFEVVITTNQLIYKQPTLSKTYVIRQQYLTWSAPYSCESTTCFPQFITVFDYCSYFTNELQVQSTMKMGSLSSGFRLKKDDRWIQRRTALALCMYVTTVMAFPQVTNKSPQHVTGAEHDYTWHVSVGSRHHTVWQHCPSYWVFSPFVPKTKNINNIPTNAQNIDHKSTTTHNSLETRNCLSIAHLHIFTTRSDL